MYRDKIISNLDKKISYMAPIISSLRGFFFIFRAVLSLFLFSFPLASDLELKLNLYHFVSSCAFCICSVSIIFALVTIIVCQYFDDIL
jgi:hypothetical protein